MSLIKQEKYEEALTFLDKALKIEPDNLQALNDKGSTLYYQGNYKEAIKCYNKILEKEPKSSIIWCNKGKALSSLKKYDEAIKCFDIALKIDPKSKIGKSNKQQNLKFLKTLKNNNKIQIYYNKGNDLFTQGEYKEALQYYNKILEIDSKYIYAWCGKGNALFSLGNYEEAIKCFDVALKINESLEYAKAGRDNAIKSLKNKQFNSKNYLIRRYVGIENYAELDKTNKTQVENWLGNPDKTERDSSTVFITTYYQDYGLKFDFLERNNGDTTIDIITITNPIFKTLEGFGVGSDIRDVMNQYNGGLSDYGSTTSISYICDGITFSYNRYNGKIDAIIF